jgi:hypothetical protein
MMRGRSRVTGALLPLAGPLAWPHDRSVEGDELGVDGRAIGYSRNQALADTDWSGCDIVVAATGKHHKRPETRHDWREEWRRATLPRLAASVIAKARNVVFIPPDVRRPST